MTEYVYERHPRTAELKAGHPAQTARIRGVESENAWVRFNAKLGLKITHLVGTMWAAYVFGFLALISLPAALLSGDPLIIVSWTAQTFLQLVLLPVIIVGQNIQARAADKRAEDTYSNALAILHEVKEIQVHLNAQDTVLGGIKGEHRA